MIAPSIFVNLAATYGFRIYSGVPCSYLKSLINYVIEAPNVNYVGATNEGDAVALALGVTLAGSRSVVLMQNSGLGNAVNPLTSLCATFHLPILLICTWRGEPGGALDEPQHHLMGEITPSLLTLLGIRWEMFPQCENDVKALLEQAVQHMDRSGRPFAIIMNKDDVAAYTGQATLLKRNQKQPSRLPFSAWQPEKPSRREVLQAVQRYSGDAALIATTGYTGRSLYNLEDNERQFYVLGGMGCASSIALGLALTNSARHVIVLDGDGAALMRLSALAMIGSQQPTNLTHIMLDNEIHESTGGQATLSNTTDLSAVAWACGYPRIVRANSADEVAQEVGTQSGELTFIHVKLRPGFESELPRPHITPQQVAARFLTWFTGLGQAQ
jgi:phosphonopyruvate decarboxylase